MPILELANTQDGIIKERKQAPHQPVVTEIKIGRHMNAVGVPILTYFVLALARSGSAGGFVVGVLPMSGVYLQSGARNIQSQALEMQFTVHNFRFS